MLSQAKYEIETKLERELGNLELLQERIDRSRQITKSMVGILDLFESRLSRLENTIVPVYNETETLQRRQQNIEKTLSSLDTVISYYSVSQEVDHIILAGPQHDPDGELILAPFLEALQKLQTAQEYFEKHSKDSMELENVTTRFTKGGDALAHEFSLILRKHSSPVKPVVLLEMCEADSNNDDLPPSLGHFPQQVSTTLIQIAEWLMDHHRDEYINVYAKVRSATLLSSIKQLRDHQRSASGSSMHNIPAVNSPMLKQKLPARKTSKRLQHALEKKANKMFLRASQTLEQSTGLTLGNRRLTALEAREDMVDEQEMDNYLITVAALQKLLQSERVLMVGIVPFQHQHKVFEIIIKDSMDLIVQDGENIAARAKKCISRHDFAAVLAVFPILKHLLSMRPDFDRTVEGCDLTIRSKFSSILNALHSTGEKALEEFIDNLRVDTASQLPKDGTVHELTSNVLVFLEQVTENKDTIGPVLAQATAAGRARPSGPPEWRALLGNYMKRVLAQLNHTLVSKSDSYADPHLKAIFLLNNYHHVLKSLQRSELMELVRLAEPDCEDTYQRKIDDNRKIYIQCWNKVLSHIYNTEDTGPLQPSRFKDKDRSAIKEKFAGFNKEIDEICRTQRGYSVPDFELRESLKRDNKELILPKYNAFYERYSGVSFSKNLEKYRRIWVENTPVCLVCVKNGGTANHPVACEGLEFSVRRRNCHVCTGWHSVGLPNYAGVSKMQLSLFALQEQLSWLPLPKMSPLEYVYSRPDTLNQLKKEASLSPLASCRTRGIQSSEENPFTAQARVPHPNGNSFNEDRLLPQGGSSFQPSVQMIKNCIKHFWKTSRGHPHSADKFS